MHIQDNTCNNCIKFHKFCIFKSSCPYLHLILWIPSHPRVVDFLWEIFFIKLTLCNFSICYLDHIVKTTHFPHMRKPCFWAFFDNGACVKQWKVSISTYSFTIHYFLAFFMLTNSFLGTFVWKYKKREIFLFKTHIFAPFIPLNNLKAL